MNRQDLDPAIIPAGWSSAMFPGFEEDSNSSCGSLGASTLSLKSGESEDNEERLCSVCGDKANGYHFHVLTCEGCKGFFRRSITKGLTFTCPFTRSCPVNKAKRRRCQACRLQKCLEVGMRKDMILSEDALTARRELRVKKRQERLQRTQRAPEAASLSEEQEQLISILIDAHRKHFDTNLENFVDYRPQPIARDNWENFKQDGSLSSPESSPGAMDSSPMTYTYITGCTIEGDTLKEIPHFADLSTYMIHQVINFAKEIPDFRSLTIDDQISLLKGATMEVSHLQYNTVFNLETNLWECGRLKFSIELGAMTGFQRVFLEPLQKFHITLRKLNLHQAEYVLMQALALFSPDRPGVVEHRHIDKIQETIAMTLKCYIDYHHQLAGSRFLFAKLLSMLAELRTLNEENAKQMVHIQNVMEDAMTPLMKEIFS
ncbi:nuclear receptor subfamily 1 group I member 3-like [Hyla sarda]|uniref:nuclear receptor subfamily 1 group I member 3-like n=1 Tax=Hyla sarda TaxID=327740 RepID=UPI0024C441F2|nr:nuclear receptor subfamily 1 group I member 3-like [Hyla sarda]XP_056401800.1 nuclear receptor subfamily 1 group I member 3-like [Hyla sarda]XP_056401801.1 nuclear receptor subfamily 1 group I member 3-like [Hyla sarda]XP_056401802.1 nuclear receptor subfamily 1 group I member 3-like [Hyla sarda]XP_056401803.1 nuclear receptor subfamily 1 group I member 3-like [Hyla sarda]